MKTTISYINEYKSAWNSSYDQTVVVYKSGRRNVYYGHKLPATVKEFMKNAIVYTYFDPKCASTLCPHYTVYEEAKA